MTDPRLQAQIQGLIGKTADNLMHLLDQKKHFGERFHALYIWLETVLPISESAKIMTLSEALVLTDEDPIIIALDPGGANRNVEAPPPGPGNHLFILINLADAAEELNVVDKDGGGLVDIAQNEVGILVSDGDGDNGLGWVAIDAEALGGSTGGTGITNLDGGVADSVYGGVGDSPVDGGDATT